MGVLTGDLFSKEAIRFLFNEMFFNVPLTDKHENDRWGNDIYLSTKLPVKYSRLFTMKHETADHYTLGIQSLLSAHAGESGIIYLRGNQSGSAVIQKDTGLPGEYETSTVSVTKTDYYAITVKEILTVTIVSKE